MTSVLLDSQQPAAPAEGVAASPAGNASGVLRAGLALALALAGGMLAWKGGFSGLLGAALAGAGCWQLARHLRSAAWKPGPLKAAQGSSRQTLAAAGEHRLGAEVMVDAVVPVWSRQMDVTREAAADGLAKLLNTFAEISGALHNLSENLSSYTLTAEPGAVDQAVRRESPALEALTAASQRAFAQRDQATAQLGLCAEGLQRLGEHAKQVRELGRQTRMMAFNASIEANRGRNQDVGASQAVASEARMLAARMAETGEHIDKEVQAMLGALRTSQRQGQLKVTSPEELRLEIDLQARKALAAMLGSLGEALQSSSEVHQAAQTLKEQLDEAFVNFQFGDRVSQMLAIVGNDMTQFVQWVAEHPRATQTDAAQWLAALEASYTMEEQRSSHHGNVHVNQGSGVDFF